MTTHYDWIVNLIEFSSNTEQCNLRSISILHLKVFVLSNITSIFVCVYIVCITFYLQPNGIATVSFVVVVDTCACARRGVNVSLYAKNDGNITKRCPNCAKMPVAFMNSVDSLQFIHCSCILLLRLIYSCASYPSFISGSFVAFVLSVSHT